MTLVAVCGIPGSGKSTVAARLKELGYDAWDTDVDGFCCWRDRASKTPVPNPRDWEEASASDTIEYAVQRDRVVTLRRRADTVDHPVYLCGFGGGEEEYWDLFDLMVVIAVDSQTLRHRLATRTNNAYGKSARQRDSLLAANVSWVEPYRDRGAVLVDGARPLDEVVAAVVATSGESPPS